MKQFKLAFLFTILMSIFGAQAFAYDLAVKNADDVTIYYNYINDGTELKVAKYPSDSKYEGNVVIPDEVTVMDRTCKVSMMAVTSGTMPSGFSGSSSSWDSSYLMPW